MSGLYAMLLPDGQWAVICTSNTHGGLRERIEPTPSINQATAVARYQWRKWEKQGVLVEVAVTRTVSVLAGGAECQ